MKTDNEQILNATEKKEKKKRADENFQHQRRKLLTPSRQRTSRLIITHQ